MNYSKLVAALYAVAMWCSYSITPSVSNSFAKRTSLVSVCTDYPGIIDSESLMLSCTHPDSIALMAIYNSTDGPNWTDNTGWGQDCEPCNWFGVTCNDSNRVETLVLLNNNLTGSLPSEINQLTEMKNLFMDQNALNGVLPAELGDLTNLEALSLHNNQISGSIPPKFR